MSHKPRLSGVAAKIQLKQRKTFMLNLRSLFLILSTTEKKEHQLIQKAKVKRKYVSCSKHHVIEVLIWISGLQAM